MEHGGEALVSLSKAIADAVESVSPSIVRVDGRGRHPASGVVYAPEMVLTANHALKRDEDVAVVAGDGSSLPARLAGRDHATDLAVLRVDGLGVEAATPALEPARVGEISVAVGRSFRDDGPRATLGIVSAVGGPLRMGRGLRLERYLQTDAAPLSGGGALVNARGAVIGVPVASLRRGTMLAVPADVAWEAAKALQSGGTARRGYLGILSQPANIPDTQRAGFD
ncbi:MAG: S1C family serine protease, partial [Rubrobacteraceae bacterium]